MAKTNERLTSRLKRIRRIRKKIVGTTERPRMRVFRSNRHIYAQIIDDSRQQTLMAVSTNCKVFPAEYEGDKSDSARLVGKLLAEKAREAGIEKVVFDRGGYLYHGRVKALSEGAREGGLVF